MKREKPLEGPFALVEKQRGAMRIVAASAEALVLGIAPGLALADARARVPGLAALAHDPQADAALIDWLAEGCARYTPLVAVDPPYGLLLDTTGCTHFYADGETGLAADLTKRLARLGLSAHYASADTPEAARALAEFGGGDLATLPVTALRVAPETHVALRRAGLRTLGDLAKRPRAPLAARFGADFPSQLARIMGDEDVHITPRRAPPAITVEATFAEPITHMDAVLGTLERLAAEGYNQDDIAKVWSGNTLRLLRAAEEHAAKPFLLLSRAGRQLAQCVEKLFVRPPAVAGEHAQGMQQRARAHRGLQVIVVRP